MINKDGSFQGRIQDFKLGGRAPGAPPGSAPAYILATVQQISAQYYLLQIVFFVCGGSTRST